MWLQGAGVKVWPQPPEESLEWGQALRSVVTSLSCLARPLHPPPCSLQTLLSTPGDSGSGNCFCFGPEVWCMGCGPQGRLGFPPWLCSREEAANKGVSRVVDLESPRSV